MSDPLQITSSQISGQNHLTIPAVDRSPVNTPPPPSETEPSLEDHIFSSSPPSEDSYLSSSPVFSRKPKNPPSEGGLNRQVRHIPARRKNEGDAEEASGFEGHSRIATFPLDPQEPSIKRSTTREKYSTRRSPIQPRKKGSVEDPTPARIRDVKNQSYSAPDLLHSNPPYRRTKSAIALREQEKKTYSITPNILEMHVYSLSQLKSTFDRLKFHPDEAASQLFHSFMHYEANRGAIIGGMVDLRNIPLEDWQLKKFYTVLTAILSTKGGGKLICAYLTAIGELRGEEIAGLAPHAIEILSKKKTSDDIHASIARISRSEIKTETRETLFRDENLSSRLCREYGNLVWGKDLNELVKTIKRLLPEKTLTSLSLKYETAQGSLSEKKDSTPEDVEQRLDENAEQFMAFARIALAKIFNLTLPEELKTMLIARRRQIIRFLMRNPGQHHEDPKLTSRTYISEVLYLRLLHPHLISPSHSIELNHIFISLSKMIQCLASEVPFGNEHDPIYKRLNPLFDEFIQDHRRFVDDNSLAPKNPETDFLEEVWV